jgi:hypothetical protein
MAKWWRAPKTEEELLDRLYDLTNGTFYAGTDYDPDAYIEWGGYEEAELAAKKEAYLKWYKRTMIWRIGKYGLIPMPGVQFVTVYWKMKFNFSAMAGSAWAYGYRKGVGPKDRNEAKSDLLAITVAWAQQHKPLNWAEAAGLPMQDTDRESFGKRLLYVMARNKSLELGKHVFGEPIGTLTAIAFYEEVLPLLGKELFQLFKEELFESAYDEVVPLISSYTAVARAYKRVDSFHKLAERYYDFKATQLA